MMRRAPQLCLAALVLAAGSAALAAPPSLVLTGQMAGDLSADGMTWVGAPYDDAVTDNILYSYTLGVGPLRSGGVVKSGPGKCSGDVSRVIFMNYDLENQNGFGTDRMATRLWQPLLGTITNIPLPPWAANCDASTISALDIARDGRYIIGGGYTQTQCGPYRAQRYDIQTNTWEILPISTTPPPISNPARYTSAWSISADGSVVVGYDENYDNSYTQYWRGASAWVKNGSTWTQTILDRYYYGAKAVSADGNTIVGYMSTQTMQATFGTTTQYPVRWTRNGTSWVPHNMGGDASMRPTHVSADGSTIIGDGPFIWRANLNGGVPMSLATYVSQLGGSFPGLQFASGVGSSCYGISDDGNTILLSTMNSLNCLTWFPGAVLYLNGAPCEPVNIIINPYSHYNPLGPIDEPGGMVFNVLAAGSWPMSFQWQKETDVGSDVWVNLTDDNCPAHTPDAFNFRGTTTMQLRLGALDNVWSGRYRCVVSNDCGSATTPVFRAATCYADFDCNGFVNGDDADMFGNLFFYGQSDCDVNGDGFVNGDDADAFGLAFDAGC